jgi:hypothetical protein
MIITYKIYLDCLKVGLIPNPEEIVDAKDVCYKISCNNCPMANTINCWDEYLDASKDYYPKVLKEAPECLL